LGQVARLLQLDEFQPGLGGLRRIGPQPVDHLAADIEQRGHRIQWWDAATIKAASEAGFRASTDSKSFECHVKAEVVGDPNNA
jgi:hypothetical protein